MSGARILTFAQALAEAQVEEMARDERVFVLGEDIGRQGGSGPRGSVRRRRCSWSRRSRRS